MAVTPAVSAKTVGGRHSFGDDQLDADREALDRGPAQDVIAEMARLLRDTRGSMLLGGSVLSALTIGLALEAAHSHSALRPGPAGVAYVSLLGCVILCWLRAAALLLLASRPVLDQLNEQRWRTGAPLDLRTPWLSMASVKVSMASVKDSEAAWNWTRVNVMLAAARIRWERLHLADTWTFITVACFLAWTVAVLLGA
jgi:hypothetical protein